MPKIRTDQGARVRLDHYTHGVEYHFHDTDHPGFRIGHADTRPCTPNDDPTPPQDGSGDDLTPAEKTRS